MRQRFEREAKTISQLSHPHICALYDVGEAVPAGSPDPPILYLAMEYLERDGRANRAQSASSVSDAATS